MADKAVERPNLITSYGLFWKLDETEWEGHDGRRVRRRLLGRLQKRTVDFWTQPGVYILYGNHGVYYAGITTKQGIGERINQHSRAKKHKDKFDRFSWFGFGEISDTEDRYHISGITRSPKSKLLSPSRVTNDIEALLHRAFPFPGNPAGVGVRKKDGFKVPKWEQLSQAKAQSIK